MIYNWPGDCHSSITRCYTQCHHLVQKRVWIKFGLLSFCIKFDLLSFLTLTYDILFVIWIFGNSPIFVFSDWNTNWQMANRKNLLMCIFLALYLVGMLAGCYGDGMFIFVQRTNLWHFWVNIFFQSFTFWIYAQL